MASNIVQAVTEYVEFHRPNLAGHSSLARTVEVPAVTMAELAHASTYSDDEIALLQWCAAVSHIGESEEVEELRASCSAVTRVDLEAIEVDA